MKKMTGVIALAVLSSAAFANTIVPETSRDGKTKNDSAIATTQQMRTFVAGEYMSGTYEQDGSAEEDYSNMNLFGGWSNKMVTVEADLNTGDYNDTDMDSYGVAAGYRINKQFALGLGYTMTSMDDANDTEGSKIEIAGSYNMGDLVLGASFAINSEENNAGKDGSYNTLTLGVGSNANNMSWEAGLTYDLEADEPADGMDRGSRIGLFAGMTKVVNNIELDADLSYTTGDVAATTAGDYTELDLRFDAEILVGKMFYVTPGISYMTGESNSTVGAGDMTDLALSADFGYRANKIDATFGIDYTVSGEVESGGTTTDYDNMAWKVNVAYLF